MSARHPEAREARRRISAPPFALHLCAAVVCAVLLASCAGVQGAKKPKLSNSLVEIIREEYELQRIEADQFILYSGTVKNWNEKNIYAVSAEFIGYDAAGKPVVGFKQDLTSKLKPGGAYSFKIRKHVHNGNALDRIASKVSYLDAKPSVLGASSN